MNSKISKDFALFLKKNKIYTKFLRYTRNKIGGHLTLRSFDWNNTVEGYLFWREVSNQYDELLSKRLQEYWTESYGRKNLLNTYGNYKRPKSIKNY